MQTRAPLDWQFIQQSEIRKSLTSGFNDQCAYCETPGSPSVRFHIHHHRPPGLAADKGGETDLKHYAWLAYDFENLYWVCDICVRRKTNKFFLEGQRGESNASIRVLRETEAELFLDPCHHDPAEHLRFQLDGTVDGLTESGHTTIETLDLNRNELREGRTKTVLALVNFLVASDQIHTRIESIKVEKTGLSAGRASEIFQLIGDEQCTYPGGATLILLEWASRNSLSSSNLSELLLEFSLLDRRIVTPLLEDLRRELQLQESTQISSTAIDFHSTAEDARPRRRAKSRLLRLYDLPLNASHISEVRIANFKALRKIEFVLPVEIEDPNLVPCMLLLGENATGKSSVLEALTLAILGTDEIKELDDLIHDEDLTPNEMIHRPDPNNWDETSDEAISVEIGYQNTEVYSRLEGRRGMRAFEGDMRSSKILLAYGPRRYFTKKKQRRFRAPAYRVHSLFDAMATVPNPTSWLLNCSQRQFDASARALREILMLGPEDYFDRVDGCILIQTEAGRVPLSELSDGYKSVIAMATDIIRELLCHYDNLEFASAVVVIDEIETHLHPRWKMRIVHLMRTAFPKVQFIVTTHDPLCLRGMYAGEVFVLRRRTNDQRIISLKDLPDVRGMRAEQILMSEFFGLGSTDPETDAKLIRYHNLVAKGEHRTEAEDAELPRLGHELEHTMKVGDTIQEQILAEAMRQADIEPLAPLGKVEAPSRREMINDLLTTLRKVREAQQQGASM